MIALFSHGFNCFTILIDFKGSCTSYTYSQWIGWIPPELGSAESKLISQLGDVLGWIDVLNPRPSSGFWVSAQIRDEPQRAQGNLSEYQLFTPFAAKLWGSLRSRHSVDLRQVRGWRRWASTHWISSALSRIHPGRPWLSSTIWCLILTHAQMVGLLGLHGFTMYKVFTIFSEQIWKSPSKEQCGNAMQKQPEKKQEHQERKATRTAKYEPTQPQLPEIPVVKAGRDRWAKYLEDLVVDQGRWLYIVIAELVCNEAFGGCDHSIGPGRGSKHGPLHGVELRPLRQKNELWLNCPINLKLSSRLPRPVSCLMLRMIRTCLNRSTFSCSSDNFNRANANLFGARTTSTCTTVEEARASWLWELKLQFCPCSHMACQWTLVSQTRTRNTSDAVKKKSPWNRLTSHVAFWQNHQTRGTTHHHISSHPPADMVHIFSWTSAHSSTHPNH